jgi:hypothetical protein
MRHLARRNLVPGRRSIVHAEVLPSFSKVRAPLTKNEMTVGAASGHGFLSKLIDRQKFRLTSPITDHLFHSFEYLGRDATTAAIPCAQ